MILKRTLSTAFLVLIMIFTLCPAGVFAQQSDKKTIKDKLKKIRSKIGQNQLTEKQREQLKSIHKKYSLQKDDIEFDLKRKMLDMIGEFRKDDPERKVIEQKMDEIIEIQKKKQNLIIDEYFEIRKVLTPQQQKFFSRAFMRRLMRTSGEGKKPFPGESDSQGPPEPPDGMDEGL